MLDAASPTISWLLENNNPAVKYRTQTEILGQAADKTALLQSDLLKSAMTLLEVGKDFADAHALTVLAEYGLTREDVVIDQYVERHIANTNFRDGCGEGLLLRNIVTLGYAEHPAVKPELALILSAQQSDGGYPCVSKNPRINKPNVPHKSCFQITVCYLLLAAEMFKKGIACPQADGIVDYFLGRDILYRHDNPNQVVKNEMGATFHPPVATRVGLHMLLHALSVLGKGNDPACNRAWALLDGKRDEAGRYILDASLTKPYLKIEKPGKPCKWVTFYALSAQKQRYGNL